METKFNFNSQICTSRKQSERLLALGLKKETADVTIHCEFGDTYILGINYCQYVESHRRNGHKEEFFKHTFPAWSLHRLLCLYGADYTIKEVYNNAEECYGMLICAIEIAIENGDFNEEYLEKQWE